MFLILGVFASGLVGGFLLSSSGNFRSILTKIYLDLVVTLRQLNKPSETSTSSLTKNRRYLHVPFEDCGKSYETFIPYDKRLGMKKIIVTGETTKKVYSFHSALLPPIKEQYFNEKRWIVKIDDEEEKYFETLENFLTQIKKL